MEVDLALGIGFCFGVKRAIQMAEDALKSCDRVYSLGHIIHNAQAVESLRKKGLKSIRRIEDLSGGVVLISSHGAPPETYTAIKKRGLKIIDTTCPFVSIAQRLASGMAREGYIVVIIGEKDHPEVKALAGFARGRAVVVKDMAEARRLSPAKNGKVAVISQTTQAVANYAEAIRSILKKRPKEIRVFNTICNDTEKRQRMASRLAKKVDVMIVIGGRNSANTNRLYEVCRRINNSHLVEAESDLSESWFRGKRRVGVASGASTPDWVIERVVEKILKIKN